MFVQMLTLRAPLAGTELLEVGRATARPPETSIWCSDAIGGYLSPNRNALREEVCEV